MQMSSNKSITKKQNASKTHLNNSECCQEDDGQEVRLIDAEPMSKQDALQLKKKQKFQTQIQRFCKQIVSGNTKDTIPKLVQIILMGQYLETYDFKGIGIDDLWVGRYPLGPLDWFNSTKKRDYVSRNPFDMLSVCLMVQILQKRIQIAEVQSIYQRLSDHFSQTFEILIGRGNAYYNGFQFLKAQQQYLKALEIKESQILYENLSWLEGINLDRDKKGIEYSQKCLSFNSENLGAQYVRIQCLPDDIAQQKAKELILKHPDYYRIYVFLGNVTEELDERMDYYKKSLCYDSNYIISYIQMAISIAKHQEREARDIISKLIRKYPNNHKVYWGLGEVQMELNNVNNALEQFKKALEFNPYHFASMKNLAYLYKLESDYSMCIHYYQRFLELNPYDEEVHNYLGLAYDDIDNKQLGIECYKKAIELNPDYFESLSNLGLSYQQDQKFQDALKCYIKANEVNPTNGGICYGLSICYEGTKDLQQAQKWALKCIQVGGDDDNEVYQFMGDIYFKKGNYLKSLQWYIKHVQVNRSLNTDYIMENLINKISRPQALQILEQIQSNIEQNMTKVYCFLQIGKIFMKLDELDSLIRCYTTVKNIVGGGYVSRVIKNQLKKVFGNPSGGIYCLLERAKWDNMRKQYYNIFKQLYEQGKPQQANEQKNMEVE